MTNFARMARTIAFASIIGAAGIPAYAADGNKVQSFDSWANSTAGQHSGRIPRQLYLDEMGRRWDANPSRAGTRTQYLEDVGRRYDQVDAAGRGLTPAEASRLSGNVDTSAGPPRTGSGAQPGNMGPGSTKGQ